MKAQKIILFLIAIAWSSLRCLSQPNPIFKYVPGNASMIMSFNIQRLGSKVPGETFRQGFMYRELMKDPGSPVNLILSNPAETGINLTTDFILAMIYDTSKGYSKNETHIFGRLNNEELFASFIKKLVKGDSVHIYGNNKMIFKQTSSIAWNNEIFVFNFVDSNMSAIRQHFPSDSTNRREINNEGKKEQEKFIKEQKELCLSLLTSHGENFFNTDGRFIRLMNTTADMKIWSNSSRTNPMKGKMNPFIQLKKLQSFAGTNKSSVINFETGKILAQNHNYLPENIAAVYKNYSPPRQNTDLIQRLPKGNLLLLINAAYNSEMREELMQKSGLKEIFDSLKSTLPFDLSLLSASFKNNVMFAAIQPDEIAATDSITQKMGIQILLALPIGNKAKFEELKSAVNNALDSLKDTKGFGKMLQGFHPYVKYNDDLCVISLSPDAASSFLSSQGSDPLPEWLKSYTQHPMVIEVNMKYILGMVMGKMFAGKETMSSENEKQTLNIFDRLIAYGGEYENESLNTTIEFQFTDQNKNALAQLFDMMNTIVEKQEQRKAQRNEGAKKEKVITDEKKNKKLPAASPKQKTVTKPKVKGH